MIAAETLHTPRGRFHYLAAGRHDASLVLCLHGFPDHAPTFATTLEALAAAGYRAVAPWLRGYAPSTLDGPHDPDALADDAIAFIDGLSPGRPAAIVGHDWGAVAAYGALAKAPEKVVCGVTMAVPHPIAFLRDLAREPAQLRRSWYMGFFQLPWAAWAVARNDFALIDRLWRAWSPGWRMSDLELRARKECLASSMPAPIAYYRSMVWPPRAAARRVREAGSASKKIRVPVLYLAGAEDGCIAPSIGRGQERMFAGVFEHDVIEGAGHFMHLERPGEVNARIGAWVREHLPRRRA